MRREGSSIRLITFKMYLLKRFVLVIFLAISMSSARSEMYEGDSCTIKSQPGVCKLGSQCPELEMAVRVGVFSSRDIVNCGFATVEEIICCPTKDRVLTENRSDDKFIFEQTTISLMNTKPKVNNRDTAEEETTTDMPFWIHLLSTTSTTTTKTTTTQNVLTLNGSEVDPNQRFIELTSTLFDTVNHSDESSKDRLENMEFNGSNSDNQFQKSGRITMPTSLNGWQSTRWGTLDHNINENNLRNLDQQRKLNFRGDSVQIPISNIGSNKMFKTMPKSAIEKPRKMRASQERVEDHTEEEETTEEPPFWQHLLTTTSSTTPLPLVINGKKIDPNSDYLDLSEMKSDDSNSAKIQRLEMPSNENDHIIKFQNRENPNINGRINLPHQILPIRIPAPVNRPHNFDQPRIQSNWRENTLVQPQMQPPMQQPFPQNSQRRPNTGLNIGFSLGLAPRRIRSSYDWVFPDQINLDLSDPSRPTTSKSSSLFRFPIEQEETGSYIPSGGWCNEQYNTKECIDPRRLWSRQSKKTQDNDDQSTQRPTTTTRKTTTISPVITRTTERPAVVACREIDAGLNNSLTPHILGGTPAEPGEFPHMAVIGYGNIGNDQEAYDYRCGGTLIANRFVLTAAHCVTSRSSQPAVVLLGMVNLTDPEERKISAEIPIRQVHIHPQYSNSRTYHDIAVLELEREVTYSEYIYPTCLFTDLNDPSSSLPLYVTGFGKISTTRSDRSSILLKAQLKIVSVEDCNITYVANGLNRRINDGVQEGQMCANDPRIVRDACEGDSGGPLNLVLDESIRKYRVVGIISAGFSCGSSTPGLYTRVAAYLDFIEGIVWPSQR